ISAGRTNREASTHLCADRYIWKEAMVNTKGAVRQFVNPLRLEALDENITRTEEFSRAQGYIIIAKIRELGIYKVHIGAATTRLDLQPAVEQKLWSQFPKEDWIERGRECGDLPVACLEHAFGPASNEELGSAEQ